MENASLVNSSVSGKTFSPVSENFAHDVWIQLFLSRYFLEAIHQLDNSIPILIPQEVYSSKWLQ